MELVNNPIPSPTPTPTNPIKSNDSNPTNTPTNQPKLDLFDAAIPTPPDRSLLMPFSELVLELTSYEKQLIDPVSGFAMTIEQVTVDMPIELKINVNQDGTVNLKASPPTQLVKTTVMPVFHQMKLRAIRDDGE